MCWFRGFGFLWNGRVVADGEEVPVAWHAFERVCAAFGELEARAGYEVADGAGNEHLAWVGEGGDAGTDVDGHTGGLGVVQLTFADMDADACLQPEGLEPRDDRLGGTDRACWTVEGGEEAVARGVSFLAMEAAQFAADERVVGGEQISPTAVAELRCLLRRTHEIGEHHRGEDAFGDPGRLLPGDETLDLISRFRRLKDLAPVTTGQPHRLCPGNPRGDVEGGLVLRPPELLNREVSRWLLPVENERRHPHRR